MLAEFYQYIDQYGLTTTKILIAVGLSILVMLFGFREIFAWFMKTNRIAKQLKQISKRLEVIEAKLDRVVGSPTSEEPGRTKNQFEFRF